MAFNDAAVQAVFDAIVSAGQQIQPKVDRVFAYEPKSAPGAGISLAIWWDSLDPYAAGSSLSAESGRVTFMARLYHTYLAKPESFIDPGLLSAVSAFLTGLSAGFTLGGAVRNVDLLGESGQGLAVKAAYLEYDGKPYRVADITIPVVINDLWLEAP